VTERLIFPPHTGNKAPAECASLCAGQPPRGIPCVTASLHPCVHISLTQVYLIRSGDADTSSVIEMDEDSRVDCVDLEDYRVRRSESCG
jgi:hypothetical protein